LSKTEDVAAISFTAILFAHLNAAILLALFYKQRNVFALLIAMLRNAARNNFCLHY